MPTGIQTRIIGGTAVDPSRNRYPYYVLVWGRSLCGGVLIAPSIVLTAAHVSQKHLFGKSIDICVLSWSLMTFHRFVFQVPKRRGYSHSRNSVQRTGLEI
jgi:V8-like Glu-specific endopeptidase